MLLLLRGDLQVRKCIKSFNQSKIKPGGNIISPFHSALQSPPLKIDFDSQDTPWCLSQDFQGGPAIKIFWHKKIAMSLWGFTEILLKFRALLKYTLPLPSVRDHFQSQAAAWQAEKYKWMLIRKCHSLLLSRKLHTPWPSRRRGSAATDRFLQKQTNKTETIFKNKVSIFFEKKMVISTPATNGILCA